MTREFGKLTNNIIKKNEQKKKKTHKIIKNGEGSILILEETKLKTKLQL